MKGRGGSTIVACLVAALIAAPSAASASRHGKRKAKRASPAEVAPRAAQTDDAEARPAADGDKDDSADSAPTPAGAPAAPAPATRAVPTPGRPGPQAEDDDAAPPRLSPSLSRPEATAVGLASSADDLALGHREAARLAAGRIETAVSIGIDVGRRQFTYSDPIGTLPRPYLLAAAPLATFGLEVYPLASTGLRFLRDLGFRGRISRAFALDSSTTNGVPLDDAWTRFAGELRARLLAPGRHALELGVSGGVDASYFDLRTKADVGALIPAARTLSLRLGVDARARLAGRLSLLAGFAYLATLSRGEIYDHFRRPRVAGIDAELGAAIALTPGLEARINGRYTRYFASFDPEVGDAAVAGGALDVQMQLGVAVRYAH